jgi:hypothetical protein
LKRVSHFFKIARRQFYLHKNTFSAARAGAKQEAMASARKAYDTILSCVSDIEKLAKGTEKSGQIDVR